MARFYHRGKDDSIVTTLRFAVVVVLQQMPMDKERYKQIQEIMQDKKLREDLERIDPKVVAAMSGYLLHPWLPVDNLRRVLMFGFIVAGLTLGIFLHPLYLLLLVVGAAHSPRIVGEAAGFLGRIFRQIS